MPLISFSTRKIDARLLGSNSAFLSMMLGSTANRTTRNKPPSASPTKIICACPGPSSLLKHPVEYLLSAYDGQGVEEDARAVSKQTTLEIQENALASR